MTGSHPDRGAVSTVLELDFVVGAMQGMALDEVPLYITNKANARIVGSGRRAYGGRQWANVRRFEAAIELAASRAARDVPTFAAGLPWPLDADAYAVDLVLEFGDREVAVVPKDGRIPHIRRDRAEPRARRYDVDSVKAILDAMQGSIFDDDARVRRLVVEKRARTDGEVGDRILVRVRTETLAPIVLEPDSGAAARRSSAGTRSKRPRRSSTRRRSA